MSSHLFLLLLHCRKLRISLLLFFLKSLNRFYLCRKCVFLPFHSRRMRLSLLNAKREFVSKHGRYWRLRVFCDQVVKLLKMCEYIHGVLRLKPVVHCKICSL